jgi:hypothetical protein
MTLVNRAGKFLHDLMTMFVNEFIVFEHGLKDKWRG